MLAQYNGRVDLVCQVTLGDAMITRTCTCSTKLAYRHGASFSDEEGLAAPLACESSFGHLEQLALRVRLPPVAHALYAHACAVAAAQLGKLLLHMRPQRLYQLLGILQCPQSRLSTMFCRAVCGFSHVFRHFSTSQKPDPQWMCGM